ncbi:MAG TPA: hypothetical protein PK874_07170 [Desulfobacteraceae bacterium]|nr:hypothetical protein [Desulfobacteraceae bacterium]HPJ66779.1 hypothetical protein [Desulfobacteraceae bacterium]HPQ26989.1 hypothetical protein [Desulfobacteraceae bacterium]
MKLERLEVKAFIKVPIYISSRRIRLSGKEGDIISREVEISAGLDKDLVLTPGDFNLEDKLNYKLEEIEKGRRFKVFFKNIPGPAEDYRGFLKFSTNYPEKPLISIFIIGRFFKAEKKNE